VHEGLRCNRKPEIDEMTMTDSRFLDHVARTINHVTGDGSIGTPTVTLHTSDAIRLLELARRSARIVAVTPHHETTVRYRGRTFPPATFDALVYDDSATLVKRTIGVQASPDTNNSGRHVRQLEVRTVIPHTLIADLGDKDAAALIADIAVRALQSELYREAKRDRALKLDARRLP
jgi:hypothetical protein